MRSLIAALFIPLIGCAVDSELQTSELAQDLSCPPPAITNTKSLTVVETQTLGKFGFSRLMSQIATSGGATNTPTAMYQGWMNSFNDCADVGVDPKHFGLACRPEVTTLANLDPFGASGYVPVAVVNRFDLAPKSGANCGEYRVIFALPQSFSGVARAFFIFEARLPNPRTDLGLAGCAPVADFWAGLSKDSAGTRAQKLDNFYFTGLVAGGETFEPVVRASHYGLAVSGGSHTVGQIRTNVLSLANGLWQLREFKLRKPCAAGASCALTVEHVSDKQNPANEVFSGSDADSTAFQTQFVTQMPALSQGSAAMIGMATAASDNEWESTSSPPPLGNGSTIYTNFASKAFRAQIKANLTGGLSVTNILDRANTQTCAGCHQLSNNVDLGGGVTWPLSLGFVQVDEHSTLSPAVTGAFLPFRALVLTQFLNTQCTGVSIVDDGRNLGGGAVDAAN